MEVNANELESNPGLVKTSSLNPFNVSIFKISTRSSGILEGEALLHNTSSESLSIQFNTFASIPENRNNPQDP